MANEARFAYATGQAASLYVVAVRSASNQYANNSTGLLENYNASNWTNYATAVSETGASGDYHADFNTAITLAGVYLLSARKKAGGSAAPSDAVVAEALLAWDGTKEVSVADLYTTLSATNVVVTLANPVSSTSEITIIQGDSYYNADGRALEWSTDSATTWPDLTGATITFTANKQVSNENNGDAQLGVSGSVVTPSGANKKVRVELSTVNTNTLAIGPHGYKYDVQATLTNTHKVTLSRGSMTVLEQQTP